MPSRAVVQAGMEHGGREEETEGTGHLSLGHLSPTFSPNRHQLHPLAGYVVQSLVDIRNLVEPHFAPVRFGQPFPWRKKREAFRVLPWFWIKGLNTRV